MNETWEPIPGYENLYAVSNLGNIQSIPREVSNARGGKYHTKRKVLKGRMSTSGYLMTMLYLQNVSSVFIIHRLVAQAFVENPNGHPHVNHKDGDKSNNNADNLEWCTPSMNMKHAYKTKLNAGPPIKYGASNHKSRPLIDSSTGIRYPTVSAACKSLKIGRTTLYARHNFKFV